MESDVSGPNILMIMCDQLSALATAPYGNHDVLTPNLMRLAQRGTRFVNAYCNSPLCAPSRAAMMSGRLPSATGVNDNCDELPSSVPTFAHQLRASGYQTVLSGKMHFVGPDQLHGFEERLTTDIYPSDFSPAEDWDALGDPPRSEKARVRGRHQAHMIRESGPVPWSSQLDYDEETQFKAVDRIRRLARSPAPARPWFLCVSFTQPHDPYAPAQEYWDRYAGRELALPEDSPADHVPARWDVWANAYHGVDVARPDISDVERMRRGYYAMATYIDDKVGELEHELERFGLLDDTVIIFTSDHGDMAGEHGMFFKRTFREWSTRVPLLFAGPGIPQGEVVSEPVSLVDIYPTLVGIAGTDNAPDAVRANLAGADLFDPDREPRPVIIDYSGTATIAITRTVVAGTFKYVYVHQTEELLYDLANDPNEWANLANDARYRDVLERLRAICFENFDPDRVDHEVRSGQKTQVFLKDALAQGTRTTWDYHPPYDASRMHVRSAAATILDRSYEAQYNPLAGGG